MFKKFDSSTSYSNLYANNQSTNIAKEYYRNPNTAESLGIKTMGWLGLQINKNLIKSHYRPLKYTDVKRHTFTYESRTINNIKGIKPLPCLDNILITDVYY